MIASTHEHRVRSRSIYTRAPVITLRSGVTLCNSLAAAVPKDADAATKKAAAKLKQVGKAAQEALGERQRILSTVTESQSAAIDHEADATWGALRARVAAYADLPATSYPKAARATALLQTLFGSEGLLFLKDRYADQRTAMAALLARIDDEGLAKEIDAIAGADFLAAVRDVQPRYDAMVAGLLAKDGGAGTPNLLLQTRAMQRAIVAYATKICAAVDDDDAASIATATKALLPIKNQRDRAPRAAADAQAAEPPDPAAPAS